MSKTNSAVYKVGLLVLAIIFIVAGAVLAYIPETPEKVALVVIVIGIVFLVVWAILIIWKEFASR